MWLERALSVGVGVGVDVKLVHDDDDGEDERCVHTRLHHHMENAFVDDNVLQ